MKNLPYAISFLIPILALGSLAIAEENDPFADTGEEEQKPSPKEFRTTGAYAIHPSAGWDPSIIQAEEWPKIENPINFNRHFDKPDKIWRVDGGYFAAFYGGEWGGGLFFAAENATKWTRVVTTHIQDLERFGGDTFLASGGLAHLDFAGGSTYLITRLPTGEWHVRSVFRSEISGIPRIVGISDTHGFIDTEPRKLIVLGFEPPAGSAPYLGVDSSGTIYLLGDRENKNKQENKAEKSTPRKASE